MATSLLRNLNSHGKVERATTRTLHCLLLAIYSRNTQATSLACCSSNSATEWEIAFPYGIQKNDFSTTTVKSLGLSNQGSLADVRACMVHAAPDLQLAKNLPLSVTSCSRQCSIVIILIFYTKALHRIMRWLVKAHSIRDGQHMTGPKINPQTGS